MLINYQGGLLRRGLVGEVAYQLDRWIPAPAFVTALLCATYVAVAAYLVFGLRLARSLAGLALLVSPLGLMFPVHVLAAFGRKDVFVLAVALLSLYAIRRMREPFAALAAILSAYAFTSFIVETDWFYLPLVGAAFVTRYREQLRGRRLVAAGTIAVVVAGAMAGFAYAMSANADLARMHASWTAKYPGVWEAASCCVGQPLSMAWHLGTSQFDDRALLRGFLAGAALGSIPLALLLAQRRPRWTRDPLLTAAWAIGVCCSAAPLFLAADWGRYLHLMLTQIFVAIVAVRPREAPTAAGPASVPALLASATFLLVFATSWTLLHFQVPGKSPLLPGPLLRPHRAIGPNAKRPRGGALLRAEGRRGGGVGLAQRDRSDAAHADGTRDLPRGAARTTTSPPINAAWICSAVGRLMPMRRGSAGRKRARNGPPRDSSGPTA
jgi:hypothetical protein